MDNYKTFITDALINYDKNIKEQNKLLKNAVGFENVNSEDETINDSIIFYDENDNKILQADYETISTFYSEYGSWIWAWANPAFKKKWTRTITKILNYGFSLDPEKNYHLKSELTNSRFIIIDPIQIDIHLAICSELSKINNIYNIIIPDRNIPHHNKHHEINSDKKQHVKHRIIKNIEEGENVIIQYIFLFNIKKFQ
jgi:hypothetical protein